VINRFSKDVYTIDEQIPQTMRSYLATVAKVSLFSPALDSHFQFQRYPPPLSVSLSQVTGVLLYICIVTPLFVVGLVPIAIFYAMAQRCVK